MKISLRMDDVGASTKMYEIYSKNRIGNISFLKYYKPFKAWGPYRELTTTQLHQMIDLLIKYKSKLTVAITSSWVEKNSVLIPFDEKFPHQAKIIKKAVDEKYIEIASHGLTHCVVGKHLPRLFLSNRKYHREFWDWLPYNLHYDNLKKSKISLEKWSLHKITSFVPSGNVYSLKTIKAATKLGFQKINCSKIIEHNYAIEVLDNKFVYPFHDRDIVINGIEWFENILKKYKNYEHKFLKEL